jgi:probable phosphoglycerate mutase
MRVFLIRHGETEWSLTGRHTGRTDVPLTHRGRRQAERLGRRLAKERFALVLTSPLSRARETCELAGFGAVAPGARGSPPEIAVSDDLVEWDYGAYEGRTTPEIREERPDWTVWTGGVPGGETVEDVGRRADRVLARVRAAASGPEEDSDVALFAHGHVLRVTAARWLDQPPDAGRLYALSTATLSVLGFERETPVIELWNEACHLEGEVEP